jgi:hypothetical protein
MNILETVIAIALSNVITVTLPLIALITKLERRITKLETEHNIFHNKH